MYHTVALDKLKSPIRSQNILDNKRPRVFGWAELYFYESSLRQWPPDAVCHPCTSEILEDEAHTTAACDWSPLSHLQSSTPRRMCFMQQEIASVETMAILWLKSNYNGQPLQHLVLQLFWIVTALRPTNTRTSVDKEVKSPHNLTV